MTTFMEALPGFHDRNGRLVTDARSTKLLDIWTVKGANRELTRGQWRKVDAFGGNCYATPTMGRAGWNIRKSFPTECVNRLLPFLLVHDGEVFLVRPTRAQVMV